MARKKKGQRKQVEWVHFGAAVMDVEISVDSAINSDISDRRNRWSGASIFKCDRYVGLRAVVIWGDDQVGEEVWFHFYPMSKKRQNLTLADLHLRNKKTGEYRYRTYKGEKKPVYGEPDPVGYLRKSGKTDQGKQQWWGHCEMSPTAINDTVALLLGSRQSYLHVVGKPGRKLVGLIRASVSLGDSGDWEEFERYKQQNK